MIHRGVMEITTMIGCRIQCTYCPQSLLVGNYVKSSRQTVMSLETFRACIDKLPTHVQVRFSGMTEPWLNPRCTDMLLYAAQRGHPIAVFSTLVGVTQADFERIREVPFTRFVVHIPDNDGKTRIPVTPELLELLVHITDFFQRSGRGDTYAASCHGAVHPSVLAALGERAFAPGRLFDTMIDRAGNLTQAELTHVQRTGPLVCSRAPALNHNVLLPNGDVLLCCQDYGMEHVVGNLLSGDYEGILASPEIKKVLQLQMMHEESEHSLCHHCNYAIPAESYRVWEIAQRVAGGHRRKDEID